MTQIDDSIGLYDPYLSAISPKGDHAHFKGGYKVWPDGARVARADLRLMCIGNSTSLWPAAAWSLELGKLLTSDDRIVAIYNGAGKGNTSSQEVVRVLRDAPGIQPDMIISLSGICDIGYLLNAKNYPFRHKYTRRAMQSLQDNDIVDEVSYGMPDMASPAQIWCRNQRLARVMAEDMGIPMMTILQPIQGFGPYPQSTEEAAFFAQKAGVVLKSANKPYGDCVIEFYTEVQNILQSDPARYDHIVDFTTVFAECPGAYRDHRHQSDKGVAHLAKEIAPYVAARLGLSEEVSGQTQDATGGDDQ